MTFETTPHVSLSVQGGPPIFVPPHWRIVTGIVAIISVAISLFVGMLALVGGRGAELTVALIMCAIGVIVLGVGYAVLLWFTK